MLDGDILSPAVAADHLGVPSSCSRAKPIRGVPGWLARVSAFYCRHVTADDQLRESAAKLLRRVAGPTADFRPGQWEAIEAVVRRRRKVLVVQRTGWGKSAVYLIATRLLRDGGAGPAVLVSPLLALMRNQIQMADRLGVRAATVNSANTDEWEGIFESVARGGIDLLLITPERLNNPPLPSGGRPDLAAQHGAPRRRRGPLHLRLGT